MVIISLSIIAFAPTAYFHYLSSAPPVYTCVESEVETNTLTCYPFGPTEEHNSYYLLRAGNRYINIGKNPTMAYVSKSYFSREVDTYNIALQAYGDNITNSEKDIASEQFRERIDSVIDRHLDPIEFIYISDSLIFATKAATAMPLLLLLIYISSILIKFILYGRSKEAKT